MLAVYANIELTCAMPVKVKNTFLDDWEDADYASERQACRRPCRTCPDLTRPTEPQPDLSSTEAAGDSPLDSGKVIRSGMLQERVGPNQLMSEMSPWFAPNTAIACSISMSNNAQNASASPPSVELSLGTAKCAGQNGFCYPDDLLKDIDFPNTAHSRCGITDPPASAMLPCNMWRCSEQPVLEAQHVLSMEALPAQVEVPVEGEDVLPEAAPSRRHRPRGRRGGRKSADRSEAIASSAISTVHRLTTHVDGKQSGAPHAACEFIRSSRAGHSNSRLRCNLYLNEDMQRPGFDLNKKILGHGGQGTKRIYDATGAKIRLRGHGSGHIEGGREAPVHLMLAVTTEQGEVDGFRMAFEMASELLRDVERRFTIFCKQKQQRAPTGACFWVGEISSEGQSCLGSILSSVPQVPSLTKTPPNVTC